jgi:iron-sulfur cluster repair protein YtfE (RIC family)
MIIDDSDLRARTVNELLLAVPATVEVFNAFGIDACCGGAVPVAEAAARDGAPLEALLDALRPVVREAVR